MVAPREDIGLNRFAPEDTQVTDIAILFKRHKKFSLRESKQAGNGEAKDKLEQLIRDVLDKHLTFDLMSTAEQPATGQKYPAGSTVQGRTVTSHLSDKSFFLAISLAYQMLVPLMSGKLNSAEKLVDQFFVAQVLLHELIVRSLSICQMDAG